MERVNITLPRSMLRVIDAATSNRSRFRNEAVLFYVHQKGAAPFAIKHATKAAAAKKGSKKHATYDKKRA